MSSYILQLPLKTEKWQEDIIDKRLEIGRQIYNALLNVTWKRYKEMVKTKRYRNLMSQLSHDKTKDKYIWKQINDIRKEFGITEYSFHKDVSEMQKHYKTAINSHIAQKIASRLWKAYDKLMFSDGTKIHYKRKDTYNSLEGKNNTTGIVFRNNTVIWGKLNIPVITDNSNPYEIMSLQNPIAYCRILRKYVKHKYRYYLQLVLKGTSPVKIHKDTGEVKHSIGTGRVGLDIGTSTIAIVSETTVRLQELSVRVQDIENKKRIINRKLDRSRRVTNPDNYNSDGTLKCKGNRKLTWNYSKHYIRYRNILKELQRKQADIRKYEHECLANYIVSLGNDVRVEDMNYKGLQKHSKNTELNDKGKYKRKKRFGKTIANHAPSMLLSIIDRKLSYDNYRLHKIDTKQVKASQYNHETDTYIKKTLNQRWNSINGTKIQRDLYSAFLIMNTDNTLTAVDRDRCKETYDNFKYLHDIEIQRLSKLKNIPSCMGITV